MDFQVPPSLDDAVYVRDVATVATCVAEALRQDCLEQGCISSAFSYASIYSGPKDCMFTIKHYFREGLITLTLEYFKVTRPTTFPGRRNYKVSYCRSTARTPSCTATIISSGWRG